MPSPHAVPQHSHLHRSALGLGQAISHSIYSFIALLYSPSKRCPTVLTPPSLCPMPSPHAVPHSLIHRSALCQSTSCPTGFTPPSLCPMPSSHDLPKYLLIYRSPLGPLHPLSHSTDSSITLPYAQYTRCPTVFNHTSLCPMPKQQAAPYYSLFLRSALCPVHTFSHRIDSLIDLHYAQSTPSPRVFTHTSLCTMPSPHAVPKY
jgi:hypothetical protein